MDVLSDAVALMRTGRVRSARMGWDGPWAQAFAPVPGAAGFHVVLHGDCWLLRDGFAPLHLRTGDVVFRPHGRGHVLADSPATRPVTPACAPGDPILEPPPAGEETITLCGAYEVEPELVHPMISDLPELIHLRARPGDGITAGLGPVVGQLATELTEPGPGSDALIPALLDMMLVHVLRAWLRGDPGDRREAGREPGGEGSAGWAVALRDPVIGAALRAMHREPGRDWTVAGLAAEAGLSRAPFARRFAAVAGWPPMAYLTWWRLSLAARMLRTGDLTLRGVAERVGYGSEFAFAAAFKRRFGVAPGRYRRVERESADRGTAMPGAAHW
ncbi:AraC family transcriptional regulator [Actinoplanes sp. NPDC023714]|uniref:AraC family transcriptional regulator n=1 Tax=Actinoplanes sp. NPDC023714 TaxID=3154322 RepID=UPI0033E5A3FD